MGFMDKVKSAASDAAAQAKVATGQAQAKIESTQLKSKMDGLAKQLGYAVFNERAHGAPPAGNDALIEEMKGLEAQIAATQAATTPAAPAAPTGVPPAPAPVTHTDAAPPAPSTSASEPTAGDFKL